MIQLHTPAENATLDRLTPIQKAFMENSCAYAMEENDWRAQMGTTEREHSRPVPILFSWTLEEPGTLPLVGKEATLELSCTPDFARLERSIQGCGVALLYNLENGKRYYWRVRWQDEVSEIRTFSTAAGIPRWLYIEGTTNVRDLGGWQTEDGRHIRQGLLYRGSELDHRRPVPSAGLAMLRDTLGIRTELDLRCEVVGERSESPMGKTLAYHLQPIGCYDDFYRHVSDYGEVFTLLADPANYPLYFHCVGGADRTGTLACVIEALCGVSAEDTDLDFELTSLGAWGNRSRLSDNWKRFVADLSAHGATRQEQVRDLLRQSGVSDETMDRIVAIFVE